LAQFSELDYGRNEFYPVSRMKKTLVLHSGGLDSTVCLLLARESGAQVISLGIDYGQKHIVELHYANVQCAKYGIERIMLKVAWNKPNLTVPINRSIEEMRQAVSPAFLPGRNALFLALACAEAAAQSISEVWIGVNAVDFSGYPDCRPEFIASFQAMISTAIPNGPKIISPLLHRSKPDIAREAKRLGISRGETWSCYKPEVTEEGLRPCGRCDACILHDHAWVQVSLNS
jgi:7-cyano-7-deazaguanine synthase